MIKLGVSGWVFLLVPAYPGRPGQKPLNSCVCVLYSLFSGYTRLNIHPFNGPLSGTTRVSRYQKGKTNLDFTEARESEWQWHQLRHMQVCTSLQTDNHASTPPLNFLQAGCPSCRPTNSVKALKAEVIIFRLLLSPRKLSRGIMESPALVCLSVCLFVTTITK